MASLPKSSTPAILCRAARRSLFEKRWTQSLPVRTITTTSLDTQPSSIPTPLLNSSAHRNIAHPLPIPVSPNALGRKRHPPRKRGPPPPPIPKSTEPRSAPAKPATQVLDAIIDSSIETLLPLLRSQPPFYITTHIHEKPYLVTQGDTLRLPFLMHGVSPGDVLRLNRASLLGSRDYTLKAGAPSVELGEKQKWLDERLFVCRATVMGVESEPLRIKEKTKRRQRHVRKVKSKHRYTLLRISEVTVNDIDALKSGTDQGVEQDALSVFEA